MAVGPAITGNQDLVGYSVSLLPLKRSVLLTDSFSVHLKKIRGEILDAFGYQNYSLETFVRQVQKLINQSNFEAWKNYKITPYTGDLHLFRVATQRFFLEDKNFLGWKPFINGKIYILVVPGDHLNLFNPPNSKKIAEILQKLLDSIHNSHQK